MWRRRCSIFVPRRTRELPVSSLRPIWGLAVSASFEIQSSTGSYRVSIEKGLFAGTIVASPGWLFIADEYFGTTLKARGVEAITLESAETVKSLDAMPAVITEM